VGLLAVPRLISLPVLFLAGLVVAVEALAAILTQSVLELARLVELENAKVTLETLAFWCANSTI